jgi:PAS domain S-box-containing protein
VFAIQAAVGAGPVLAFPLYLTVILLTALQLSRTESLATALLSAIAILLPTVFGGQRLDLTTAGLLAIVLVVAAVAITEVVHQIRSTAAQAQRHAGEVAASEERQRLMLEAALVGLAVMDAEGRWVQVNERLGTILGRQSDELLQLPIEEVTAENDRAVLGEALAMLRSGDIVRWEAELLQIRDRDHRAARAGAR